MNLLNPMDDDQLDAIIEGLERIKELEAKVARLRLTDAEREVLRKVLRLLREGFFRDSSIELVQAASVIDGLLERLGGER